MELHSIYIKREPEETVGLVATSQNEVSDANLTYMKQEPVTSKMVETGNVVSAPKTQLDGNNEENEMTSEDTNSGTQSYKTKQESATAESTVETMNRDSYPKTKSFQTVTEEATVAEHADITKLLSIKKEAIFVSKIARSHENFISNNLMKKWKLRELRVVLTRINSDISRAIQVAMEDRDTKTKGKGQKPRSKHSGIFVHSETVEEWDSDKSMSAISEDLDVTLYGHYTCQACGMICSTGQNVRKHLATRNKKNLYKCQTCGSSNLRKVVFNRNKSVHAKGKKEKKMDNDKHDAREHNGNHFNIRNDSSENGEAWENDSSMSDSSDNENMTKKRKKRIVCKTCGSKCPSVSKMQIHMRSHTGIKPFKCKLCDKCFTKKYNLQRHEEAIHAIENTNTKNNTDYSGSAENANICENDLNAANSSEDDMMKKQGICAICGKKFQSIWKLKRHVRLCCGVNPYKCKTCGKKFNRKYSLTRHEGIHGENSDNSTVEKKKQYPCRTCGKMFLIKYYMIRHVKLLCGKTPLKCKVCGKDFRFQNSLTEHLRVHTGEKPFLCGLCGDMFKQSSGLLRHMEHHNGVKATCDICGKTFDDQAYRNSHAKSSHADKEQSQYNITMEFTQQFLRRDKLKKFTCDVCGQRCTTRRILKRHEQVHTNNAKNYCKICDKSFVVLEKHMLSHTGEKKYVCDICGRAFSRGAYMTRHLRRHTKEKPYKCSVCDRTFAVKERCVNHMRNRHSDDKKHKCGICGKGFIYKYLLENHSRIHTGEKQYVCEVCGKGFTTVSRYSLHKVEHIDEIPHVKCDICGLKFLYKSLLDIHIMKKHSGEKPFRCDTCGKGFILKQQLHRHELVHTGEKPFKCDICGKQFNQSNSLTRHGRIHTGEKPFVCVHCGMGFNQTGGLKSHMKKHVLE